MDKVINHGMPHIGEQIFESIDTPGLIKCLEVSETWRELAENVLVKRWKGKMFEACKNGETKVVQLLLENCTSEESGLNTRDELGATPFIASCYNGHKDVVKLLLDHSEGIELNARNYCRGWTAFKIACRYGQTDVVKLLLDHFERIDLNARYQIGTTAFIMACVNGDKNVVKLILDMIKAKFRSERIEPNARDNDGWTAYMIACRYGHKDVVKLLLDMIKAKFG